MSTQKFLSRAVVVTAAVGVAGLLGAGSASAHVSADVYGDPLEQGGYGAIVIRVPNEEPDAGTTKVRVTIPKEYGITSARTKPVPGWTAEVTGDDAVTAITWTARPGHEIPAGTTSYQEFPFTVGPLPKDVDTLVLPAEQTYTDGTVVAWNAPPTEDAEPEHPAPVVPLAASSGDGHGHSHGTAAAEATAEHSAATTTTDNTARWLGGAGLALGALGLGVGVGATLRARKKVSS